MPDRVIHIQWQGPIDIEAAMKVDGPTDHGLYQVYGAHPVYGGGILLYIGKASRQTFASRLKQESWANWEYFEGKVNVHLGRLHGATTPATQVWEKEIDLAEALLITSHKPAHNRTNVGYLSKRTDKAVQKVHVFNWGEIGRLLPEVSGGRWTTRYDSMPTYDAYGSH